MTTTLTRATNFVVPTREAGGDNEVPRDKLGRPKVWVRCDNGCDKGRLPSEKRPAPATVKCSKCTEGWKQKAYTRTTTYIDVLEDKSALMAWKARMTLVGAALDPSLVDTVTDHWYSFKEAQPGSPEEKSEKDWLTRRAESAANKAGASDKAERGTYLHGLSELVDKHLDLPDDADFEAIIDLDAYRRATHGLMKIFLMEQLMVLDEYKVAGTPDRVSTPEEGVTLIAPDGTRIEHGERVITDLKTGTIREVNEDGSAGELLPFGQLKMAMQLAIYSRSWLYDKDTGKRRLVNRLNQDWGLIMSVPAGSGECELLWADLRLGWQAVQIAREVRALRNGGRHALTPMEHGVRSVSPGV